MITLPLPRTVRRALAKPRSSAQCAFPSHSTHRSNNQVPELYKPSGSVEDYSLSEPIGIHPVFSSRITHIAKVPHFYTHLFLTYTQGGIFGEGSSIDVQRALLTSVYEGMERYLATLYDPQTLLYGSYRDLRPEAVDVKELVLMCEWEYENANYPYVKYGDELKLHWLRCYEIRDGDLVPRLIPATLAILRYSWTNPSERFTATLSPGTASGPTYAAAVLHGLYELIERDAFVITWLNKLSCPKIKVKTFTSQGLTNSYRRLREDGFQVDFINITTELKIPVVLTIITQGKTKLSRTNYMAFGLGSNLNLLKALERSYAEALELMVNYYDFNDPRKINLRNRKIKIPGFDLERYFDQCSFLAASKEETDLANLVTAAPKDCFSELTESLLRLSKRGLKTYFADLTPSELKKCSQYRLVRVFASYLQPHLYEWDCWRLDNHRIYSAPVEMGLRKRPLDNNKINLLQNPFAVLEQLT